MNKGFKGYFVTGLLVVVPLYLSIYTLTLIVGFMDSIFTILPSVLQPDNYLPFHIPGLGIVFTVFAIFIIGVLAQNFLGKTILQLTEKLMGKVPVLRMIYNSTKQFMETFFSNDGKMGFRKVVLIQFPSPGLYSIGFITGKTTGELRDKTVANPVSIFLPTTPNPTTGYYIVVDEKEVIPLDMTIEDAFKVIITGGMVMPNNDEFKGAVIKNGAKVEPIVKAQGD